MRKPNSTRSGSPFSLTDIEAVWRKGKIAAGRDPRQFRQDVCGAIMKRSDYGKTNSRYGWEIDHILPVSKDGSDRLNNLQPLHWQNNRSKGDSYPQFNCAV